MEKTMIVLPAILILAAFAMAAAVALANVIRNRGRLSACNVAEGTHAGSITRKTDAAIATRHLLVKVGSDADHIAACGASEVPIGTVPDEAAAAEENVEVALLGSAPSSRKMVASEAITAGEKVYTAASGKVQDLPTDAGTYYCVGTALTPASADGDVIEVDPAPAQKEVVSG